jgi:hypothetical protein
MLSVSAKKVKKNVRACVPGTLFHRVITEVFLFSIRYPDSKNVVAHIGEKVDEGSSEDYDASDDGYPGNTVHRRETKKTKEKVVIKHSVIEGRGKTLIACKFPLTGGFCHSTV